MRRRQRGLIYTVHDLSRGTVTSVSGFATLPAPTLRFSALFPLVLRPEFSGESRFDLRSTVRALLEAAERKDRGENGKTPEEMRGGWRGGKRKGEILSFISSHFRQSPRYSGEFTTRSIL